MCCQQVDADLYKKIPILYALLALGEAILGSLRIKSFCESDSVTCTLTNFLLISNHMYIPACIIDLISSIIPALVIIIIAVYLLLMYSYGCACLLNFCTARSNRNGNETADLLRDVNRFFLKKYFHRFVTLNCNWPCYQARPKLRFIFRFIFLSLSIFLRSTATILYSNVPNKKLSIYCAVSIIFIFLTFIIDFYRYLVWWFYIPQNDRRCYRRSKKHERYIPYHLLGDNRNVRVLGNGPCQSQPCSNTKLDHIAIFHASDYQPQKRWREIVQASTANVNTPLLQAERDNRQQPYYIGFHTTKPEAAISIAHSEFRPSDNGWLGTSVYFARSILGTIGKARSNGAWIIDKIRMGRVYEVDRCRMTRNHRLFDPQLYDYVHGSYWHNDYDTCYLIHDQDNRDEFVIKDPEKQIIKWAIVIEEQYDNKVKKYGLDTEFDSTKCGWI